ncbi:MAG: nucleotide exchange factor GrpE [Candidatus Moraniibacteriota bacterium]|nr:MAG: nucleotide exchange factor GrpE [Candidatus Moranbacteria bacterium]
METKVVDGKFIVDEKGHELFQISQKIVVYDPEKKVFLMLKIADIESFFVQKYGVWDFPGGRVDVAESLEDSLSRELGEEIGFDVDESLKQSGVFLAEYRKKRVLTLGYTVQMSSSQDITLSSEHSEYRWVTAEEVAQNDEFGSMAKYFISAAVERLKEREYLNDVKRISADFENYRRRQEERMRELSAMSSERFALDIIPVIDNFRMAAQHVPEAEKENAWMTGITYIGKQLEEALATNGISAFEVKEGDTFDPHVHEAVSREEGESAEEGKVAKMLQMGYKSGSRVIRPAKVVVR